MFGSGNHNKMRNSSVSLGILDACHLVAAADGRLWVQPTAATLVAAELGEILVGLSRSGVGAGSTEIVFDLSRVEVIGPQWTVILAMLMNFARQTSARCRIASLKAQPAAVVALYRVSVELMKLIVLDSAARLAA